MQIKTTIRFHFKQERMAVIKKHVMISASEIARKKAPLNIFGGNIRYYNHYDNWYVFSRIINKNSM